MKGLDLFAGAGGCSMGYSRAGFEMTGVDHRPQPHYPFRFVQADALEALTYPAFLAQFSFIHASPPCQHYSTIGKQQGVNYPDLYEPTRALLIASGLPWVIENVIGAPYRSGFVLCGSMFGLRVRRHRNFESSELMFPPPCNHKRQGTPLGVYGNGGGGQMTRGIKATPAEAREAMGIDWMTHREISQAIPPAYCEWIGAQLLEHLRAVA